MVKDVGGREAILVNAGTSCIVLSENERKIIAEKKGNMSMSAYIRECIQLRVEK